jgi:ribosomal protein S18 acetylase RimI-like enzyme
MATITNTLPPTSTPGQLRPFDARRDLARVADLVETCFAETLDPDGQRYLQQMRMAARTSSLFRWLPPDLAGVPVRGFVWEEAGRLVGNVSLIPYQMRGRMRYLIANVAVHPNYRRRGIARQLTEQSVQFVQQKGLPSVWLHVRENNAGAVRLYQDLDFQEQARRTTWHSGPLPADASLPEGVSLSMHHSSHWQSQLSWLKKTYPDELSWHLPLNPSALRPGLWGFLTRTFSSVDVWQRSAFKDRRLIGVLARQSSLGFADYLWLAADPENEDEAVLALLRHARRWLPQRRSLALEYPARRAVQAFQAAGFVEHQTLIWMRRSFRAED